MNLKLTKLKKCFNHVFQMPKRKGRDLLCWIILFAFTFLHGCGYALKRSLTAPAQFQSLDNSSPFLKAHMHDGKVYILSSWKVNSENRTVTGPGKVLNANREILETGEFTIPIDSVAIFETNTQYIPPEVQTGAVLGTGLVIGLVAVTIVIAKDISQSRVVFLWFVSNILCFRRSSTHPSSRRFFPRVWHPPLKRQMLMPCIEHDQLIAVLKFR